MGLMTARVFILVLLGAGYLAKAQEHMPAERLKDLKGLENVGRVADGIYRGAQPSAEGLDTLKKMGVKTVINLRHFHGSKEEAWCGERGLDYLRIVTETSDAPKDEDVRKFLDIVTDPKRQPVYFHCAYGKDRTGMMCAVYRMAVGEWGLSEAVEEMDEFGFRRTWRDLRGYVEKFPERKATVWPNQSGQSLGGRRELQRGNVKLTSSHFF